MAGRVPLRHRLAVTATWPLGIAITAWSYVWRTTPIHRREREGTREADSPPALPGAGVSLEAVQRPEHGAGPLFRRRYSGTILDTEWTPERLMATVKQDPGIVAPMSLARFQKALGEPGEMALGDEWLVRMPGPWDGPVRVIHLDATSFRFACLDGHLEAGQIEWRADRDPAGGLVFQIESWARPGDRVSAIMHHHLRMAKEVQLHMWTSVVEQVRDLAGGRLAAGIDIDTRVVDWE
jgi:uncharacterized protein DUF1990